MRLAALTLVLPVLFAIAPAAQAGVSHSRKSPAAISAYWTKARMEAAKPRAVERAGKPSKGSSSSWSRLAVPTPYAGADRTNGKVFVTFDGIDYVCSGTSVATAAGSLVWTAGHCVHEGPGEYAENFLFVPAYLSGAAPYGEWASTALGTTDQFAGAGDLDYDVGAARVVPAEGAPPSGTLGQIEPPRAVAFDYAASVGSTTFKAYGYPAAGRFDGQRMWLCDSTLARRDGSAANAPMGIGCDMTGGSSGGGWIDSLGRVASVNSYGYQWLKNVMFGPYQGATARSLYEAMD